jgi:hypothetical protein
VRPRRTTLRFLARLIPDEPLFPYGQEPIPRCPEEIPQSVKYWCHMAIAFNAVALIILMLILKQILVPMMVFLTFTLMGPIYYLWNWEFHARTINLLIGRVVAMPPLFARIWPSFLWVYFAALLLIEMLFAAIVAIVVAHAMHAGTPPLQQHEPWADAAANEALVDFPAMTEANGWRERSLPWASGISRERAKSGQVALRQPCPFL